MLVYVYLHLAAIFGYCSGLFLHIMGALSLGICAVVGDLAAVLLCSCRLGALVLGSRTDETGQHGAFERLGKLICISGLFFCHAVVIDG